MAHSLATANKVGVDVDTQAQPKRQGKLRKQGIAIRDAAVLTSRYPRGRSSASTRRMSRAELSTRISRQAPGSAQDLTTP